MIRIHQEASVTIRWIGVDLNTTGHVAVLAEPRSGKVLKLGKNIRHVRSHIIKNCTKLYREGKLWKLKRFNSRERKDFRASLHKIARQIVSFAETHCSGIKFERLFSKHHRCSAGPDGNYQFSFENGSFFTLQRLVEERAGNRGIPVIYVDPTNTSKRCSRCGAFGKRYRKRFERPRCGNISHADVNAAFNIANTHHSSDLPADEINQSRLERKRIRLMAEAKNPETGMPAPEGPAISCQQNILAVLE